MTREECIKWLKSLKTEIGKAEHGALWHYAESIDTVIETLSANAETKCVAKIEVDTEEIVKRIKEEYDIMDAWIPCSERLPKENERVLIYDNYWDIDFGKYDKGQWYWEAEACADYWAKNDGVIAWMPLPKPYKGGDE